MKKRQGKKKTNKVNKNRLPQKELHYLLEKGTLETMRTAKKTTEAYLKYYWDFYADLARQRNEIIEEIKKALIQTCIPYELKQWQRAVKYKYGLHPLSTVGSLTYIGGRFNTGVGVNSEVQNFPGLYLAQDKDTALQEHLGQAPLPSKDCGLTPREMALTNPSSETIVSISGKLDMVFDLTNKNNLDPFMKLIKNFKFSKNLKEAEKRLSYSPQMIIKSTDVLLQTLLDFNWRELPSNYDVPSNSQIFGQLVYSSGIEGILYPSKFTKKLCIVAFPRNFKDTESYLMISDDVPDPRVPIRVDKSNWRICELTAKELFETSTTKN